MENIISTLAHWLPLIQGFAALFSIGGAIFSWRYARKAARTRIEMTKNIVSLRVLEKIESNLKELRLINKEFLTGKQHLKNDLKTIFEDCTACINASIPYLDTNKNDFGYTLNKVSDASQETSIGNVDMAIKSLANMLETLKTSATARQVTPIL